MATSNSVIAPPARSRRASTGGRAADPLARWDAAIRRVMADPSLLDVHVQPIADLARGEVAGYEALARFAGPPRASPQRWFDAAAATGHSERLEALAVERALALRALLPANTFLAVNVSPRALVCDEVQALWPAAGDLSAVVIELTERAPVGDYARLNAALEVPRAAGACVGVDDAGAGYSTLAHVLATQPDFVKVDRSLVHGCRHDEAKRAAVNMLGGFADRIDACLVAEGIECAADLDAVVQLNVTLGQGWHLGRPHPTPRPLAPGAASTIRRRAARTAGGGIHDLVEPVGGPDQPRLQLDAAGRPVAFVDASGARRATMRTEAGVAPAALVRRALARPAPRRFDPLVCVDATGACLGVIRMERLIDAAVPGSGA